LKSDIGYIAEFFLQREMFQTKVVEKIKTHILCQRMGFPPKIVPLWETVQKHGTARQTTKQYNTAHAHYVLDT